MPPHPLEHSKGKSVWGPIEWKQSLSVGTEVNCWVPTWQSAGCSGREILYRCSCQWRELLPLSWEHAMFCRLDGLRMKIQLPFISRMPAPCHGCPLLRIFFSLHGFNGFGPFFHFSFTSLLSSSPLLSLLRAHKKEDLYLSSNVSSIIGVHYVLKA